MRAASVTSGLAPSAANAMVAINLCSTMIAIPSAAAKKSERISTARISWGSPAPSACAVRPAVAMRKKPKPQKMKSNRMAPALMAPRRCACPSRPITAASAKPRSGVVMCASVIGSAMRMTARCETSTRATLSGAFTSCERGSARSAEAHEPQDEPDRHDDDRTGQDVVPDLAHRIEAERPDIIREAAQIFENLKRRNVEPDQKRPDQHRGEQEPEEHGDRRATEKARDHAAWRALPRPRIGPGQLALRRGGARPRKLLGHRRSLVRRG